MNYFGTTESISCINGASDVRYGNQQRSDFGGNPLLHSRGLFRERQAARLVAVERRILHIDHSSVHCYTRTPVISSAGCAHPGGVSREREEHV